MTLVSSKHLLLDALAQRYAIGGFNVQNLEMVQAVAEAAQEERSPLIIQFNPANVRHVGMRYAAALAEAAAHQVSVPVVLHLDHGVDYAQTVQALRAGFTSMMYDGTPFTLEENITVTRDVCLMAHAAGVAVEGEIGQMGGQEEGVFTAEGAGTMSDPDEAARYVTETGVDSLAVAVGNVHGMQTAAAQLDLERITRIRALVGVPLVIHGGSGVPEDAVREAIGRGVCKFNVATQLNQGFMDGMLTTAQAFPNETNPRAALAAAREQVKEAARVKMRLYGSNGRV